MYTNARETAIYALAVEHRHLGRLEQFGGSLDREKVLLTCWSGLLMLTYIY